MQDYTLTAFSKAGDKLMDETFTAADDVQAKKLGNHKLAEKNYLDQTHRCVSSDARLVLFHR